MVDTAAQAEREVVAGKSILKRRERNENKTANNCDSEKPDGQQLDVKCGSRGSASRRSVTFDDMITVKNDTDSVVKKSLKLELVIENWKSNEVGSPSEKTVQPSPGLVQRLVDEFNTIEDPLIGIPKIELTLFEEDNVKEDELTKTIRTDKLLCEALKTVDLTTDN